MVEETPPQEDDWKGAFGRPTNIDSAVALEKYGFVPTSILDFDREDKWQLMTPEIRDVMGKVEHKRGIENKENLVATQFNSGLCRFLVQYYTNPGDVVLDPFAGFGTRAYVSMLLGRKYIGWDVAKSTVEAVNRALDGVRQRSLDGEHPGTAVVYFADGIKLEGIPDNTADAILTCPPYHNREIYQEVDPAVGYQLSRVDLGYWEMFMKRGMKRWWQVLKPGALAILVTGDWREEGTLYPFAANVITWGADAGFQLHDIALHKLRTATAMGIGTFMKSKFVVRAHETITVLKKPGG